MLLVCLLANGATQTPTRARRPAIRPRSTRSRRRPSQQSATCGMTRGYSPPPLTPASSRSPYPACAAWLGGPGGGGGGQREDHGEPAAGGVLGFHGAAHRLGQAAGYREAEPDTC